MPDVTYYWIAYDESSWEGPESMVDGELESFAIAPGPDECQNNTENTCDGSDLGTITKVEVRGWGFVLGAEYMTFQPRFPISGEDGDIHPFRFLSGEMWSDWIDITTDSNAPDPWGWEWIQELWLRICSGSVPTLGWYMGYLEVRVTYEVVEVKPTAGSGLVGWTP